MKKIASLLLFAGILSAGCKKENNLVENTNKAASKIFTIKNGVVAFTSVAAYRNLLEGPPQELTKITDAIKAIPNYHSLGAAGKIWRTQPAYRNSGLNRLAPTGNPVTDEEIADILEDPFISTIVNEDGLVIIGDYIFNIDIVTEKCYALHTSWLNSANAGYYYDLIYNGESRNDYVFEFSTDDEALEMLEDWGWPTVKNDAQQLARRCGERGAQALTDRDEIYFPFSKEDNRQYYYKIKLSYLKLAILFKLNAHYKAHTVGWPLPTTNWVFQTTKTKFWRFKPKCWQERIHPFEVVPAANNPISGGWYEDMWYSTRGLSKYDVQFQFWFTKKIDGQNVTIQSRLLQIKSGY